MFTISNCQSLAILLPFGIVFERSPIRSFAADCPLKKSRGFNLALIQIIFSTFVTFTLESISSLRCSLFVFRVFQQLDKFLIVCRQTIPQIFMVKYYVALFIWIKTSASIANSKEPTVSNNCFRAQFAHQSNARIFCPPITASKRFA